MERLWAEMLSVFHNVAAKQHPVVTCLLIDVKTTPYVCNDPTPCSRFHNVSGLDRWCRSGSLEQQVGCQ
jgi:hypothetical protein